MDITPEKLKQIKLWGSIGAIVIAVVVITLQLTSGPTPGENLTPTDPAPAGPKVVERPDGKKITVNEPKVWETDRGTTMTDDNGVVTERVGGGVLAPGAGGK
jgi:hypothetical protein